MDLGLKGRTALVTPGDDAIGAACARVLAGEGAAVVTGAVSGPVDIVVAHGPGGPTDLMAVTSAAELHDAFDPVVATVELYRRVLPSMAANGWGRLVWVGTATSRSLDAGDDELGAIATLAMRSVGKVAASEVGPSGITANAVLYGGEATDDDVAAAVAFLCSEGAGYITGVSLTVDGAAGASVF
jgi:3-oxoacyl-[acyl-carrier protein] reductase